MRELETSNRHGTSTFQNDSADSTNMTIHSQAHLDQVAAVVANADTSGKAVGVSLGMIHLKKGHIVKLAAIGTENLAADTTVMLASQYGKALLTIVARRADFIRHPQRRVVVNLVVKQQQIHKPHHSFGRPIALHLKYADEPLTGIQLFKVGEARCFWLPIGLRKRSVFL